MQTAEEGRERGWSVADGKHAPEGQRVADSRRVAGRRSKPTLPEDGVEGVRFHYSREERLRKYRGAGQTRKLRLFSNKRTRSLIIIFIDLALVAVVIYLINRPANLYMREPHGDALFELNVTGIKGGRVMIGFTLQNLSGSRMELPQDVPVVVRVRGKNGRELTFQKYLEERGSVGPNESTSVVFLVDEDELPAGGELNVFYGDPREPVFSRYVRF